MLEYSTSYTLSDRTAYGTDAARMRQDHIGGCSKLASPMLRHRGRPIRSGVVYVVDTLGSYGGEHSANSHNHFFACGIIECQKESAAQSFRISEYSDALAPGNYIAEEQSQYICVMDRNN